MVMTKRYLPCIPGCRAVKVGIEQLFPIQLLGAIPLPVPEGTRTLLDLVELVTSGNKRIPDNTGA